MPELSDLSHANCQPPPVRALSVDNLKSGVFPCASCVMDLGRADGAWSGSGSKRIDSDRPITVKGDVE
jgi:hypothetical protein